MSPERKILVVDDDVHILESTVRILSRAGYTVSGAADGEEGFRLGRDLHPFLVLADVNLPDLDGRELCTRIKNTKELQGTLVLLISAEKISTQDIVSGLGCGADGYLRRPVHEAELLAQVAAYQRIYLAEASLAASLREKETLVQNLPDIIMRFDRQYRHIFVNDAVPRKSGLSADWYLGKTNRDIGVPPELCDLLEGALEAVFSTGERQNVCFGIPYHKPSRWFESILVPEHDSAGIISTVLSVSRDITELRNLSENLRMSLEKYQGLVECSPNAICRWLPDLTITYSNQVYASLRGMSQEFLLGKNWLGSLPEAEREETLAAIRHSISTGEPSTTLNTIVSSTGSRRILQWTDIPIRNPAGGISEFQSIGVDITERVNREHNLELTAAVLATMTTLDDRTTIIRKILTLIKNHLKIEACGIRLCSEGSCPYFDSIGLPEPVLGCTSSSGSCSNTCADTTFSSPGTFAWPEGKAAPCFCEAVIQGFASLPGMLKSGSFRTDRLSDFFGVKNPVQESGIRTYCHDAGFESMALIPLIKDDRIIGLLHLLDRRTGRFSDEQVNFLESLGLTVGMILEKSRLKEELATTMATIKANNAELETKVQERTKRLEAANLELESFSYSVSHDLKAPLRRINGFAKILSTSLSAPRSEATAHYIEVIQRACAEMAALVDGLLEFSRAVRSDPVVNAIHLGDVVSRTVEQFQEEIQERGIKLVVGELPVVRGNFVLLNTVMTNLLSNAIKFSSRVDGPEIRISGITGKMGFRGVCMTDNGAGFDMSQAERLFQPFQRLHGTREFEGSGIGLATVRRIIEWLGGEVNAEGSPGKGASFSILLPSDPP